MIWRSSTEACVHCFAMVFLGMCAALGIVAISGVQTIINKRPAMRLTGPDEFSRRSGAHLLCTGSELASDPSEKGRLLRSAVASDPSSSTAINLKAQ